MKNLKILLSVLALEALTVLPSLAQNLQVPIPSGWLNVSAKVAQGDTDGLSLALLTQAKNSLCRLLVVDPKTLKDAYPAYLANLQLPLEGDIPTTDEGFRGLADGMKETVKKNPGVTYIGDKIETLGKTRILRVDIEMPLKIKGGKNLVIHAAQYIIPNGGKAMLLACYAPKSNWDHYGPLFETVVTTMLK